jgi:DNA modification methylase
LGNGENMKHEFLSGDAMEDIIVDESIELFIMYPPYLGIDIKRYASPKKQINNVKNKKQFVKNLVKATKNAEKALKTHGSILMILPVTDPSLVGDYINAITKKSKMQMNTTLLWSYHDKTFEDGMLRDTYCQIVHLSKGNPRHDAEYINEHLNPVFVFEQDHEDLFEKYGKMGTVGDSQPVALTEHLIKMFSKEGDTVADLFGGTGTICIAAENTGRNSVYNDVSNIQLRIAKKRLEDLIDQKKRQKK